MFSALAGEPGSPRSAWGPRRGRFCTRRNEQHSPLPGWEIRGRPPPGAGGTASALVAPPAAPANAALGRSPRRQESTGVTHASRRPRRRSRRRPPWRPAQRAARRRHTEHQGREAPASSIQWDQILTRFLPGLSIKAFAAGSSSLLNLLLIGDGVFGIAGWEGDPAGPQAPWICRAIDVKHLIPRVSSFIPH